MRKFRLYYDKDKEEIWLNQMCSKGWGMTRFFMGVYTFEPCIPDEYTYQVDLPDLWGTSTNDKDRKKREYIEFIEETGAEYVCTWGFYMVFRKKKEKGDFKLYTDPESQIKLYQRIRKLFFAVLLLDLAVSILETMNFVCTISMPWNPSIYMIIIIELICIAIMYSITGKLVVMIVQFTRKIQELK
ncbi:DUF2812 domain-containing protein [Lachnospiraceae bacterium 66-29]